MRKWIIAVLATVALAGCYSSTETSRPTTLVVPQGATVTCPSGTTATYSAGTYRC
jgi:hypothetical protein